MTDSKASNNIELKWVSYGNSLTQGDPPPYLHQGKYQYWAMQVLKKAGYNIFEENHGIGGQLAGEISIRVPNGMPADIITIMAGTNDCWRFSDYSEDLSSDMRKDVLEQLELAVKFAREGGAKVLKKPVIILCSVPAIRVTKATSPNILQNIIKLRDEIKSLANKLNVYFCDVYEAMLDPADNKQARAELVILDGVHFTVEGNKVVGSKVGNCIVEALKKEEI
ncbi:MAG: SGNH/GDSL hydrolase family protein [Promethearchaeota archaeon]